MTNEQKLAGRVALVTGGARRQVEAETMLLARHGAAVLIGDVLDTEGIQLAEELVATWQIFVLGPLRSSLPINGKVV